MQLDDVAGQSSLPDLEQGRARRAQEHHRPAGALPELLNQVEQRRLGPVQVFPDEHERTRPGEQLEEPPHGEKHLVEREGLLDEAHGRREALGQILVARH